MLLACSDVRSKRTDTVSNVLVDETEKLTRNVSMAHTSANNHR